MPMDSTMRRNFIHLKIGAILFLIFIFYIGLLFISNLVSERQSYQQQVINDIANEQIRPQQIIAPYLKLPYQVQTFARVVLIGLELGG